MTTAELTQQATDKAKAANNGVCNEDGIATAIAEGLVDGDRISVGGGVAAVISGETVTFVKDGKTGGEMQIADLSQQQRDVLIINKAAYAGRMAHTSLHTF